MPFRLVVPRSLLDGMVAQARAEQPNECCGLLAGLVADGIAQARERFPLVNALASPTEYESEPRSMFQAMRAMWDRGLDIVAIYHSHPTSAPIPSRKDLARNYSAEVVNLILALEGTQPEVRAWWLTAETYTEAAWEVVDEPGTHEPRTHEPRTHEPLT